VQREYRKSYLKKREGAKAAVVDHDEKEEAVSQQPAAKYTLIYL
jgi:hypothetical protein